MLIPWQAVKAEPLAPGWGKTTWPARSVMFSVGTRPCRLAAGHQTVGPVFAEMRTQHDGPVVIVPDLTVFNTATDAGVARQATIDPFAWPVAGPARKPGPPVSQPPPTAAVAGRRPHHRLTPARQPVHTRRRASLPGTANVPRHGCEPGLIRVPGPQHYSIGVMLPRAPRHHHGNAVRRALAAIEHPRR
jgi:hypothetical protein